MAEILKAYTRRVHPVVYHVGTVLLIVPPLVFLDFWRRGKTLQSPDPLLNEIFHIALVAVPMVIAAAILGGGLRLESVVERKIGANSSWRSLLSGWWAMCRSARCWPCRGWRSRSS